MEGKARRDVGRSRASGAGRSRASGAGRCAGTPAGKWLALLLLCTPAAGPAQTVDPGGIPLGARPDPVRVEDLAGNPVDLGELAGGKPLLVEFWAAWCLNCRALHPRLVEAYERYGDRVRFAAVAVAVGQTRETVRRALEERPVPFPTLWDGRGDAVRAFDAPATSFIVVLGSDGRVAYTGLGSDQDIAGALRGALTREGGRAPDGD